MKQKESFENNVIKTAGIMVAMTLFSKLLGFCRELVLAGSFGTSYVMDAYVMAQTLPTFFLGGVLGSIGAAYLPIYSQTVETQGAIQGNRFTSNLINLMTVIAFAAFLLGLFCTDEIVPFFSGSFAPEAVQLTASYLKITIGYTLFSCGVAILDAYLQYNGHFYPPVIGGYLLNLGIIIVAVISAKVDVRLLAFGTMLGYFLNLLFLYYKAHRSVGYRHRLTLGMDRDIRQVITIAFPVFFSGTLQTLNTVIDKTLAARLPEGGVAALNYGALLVTLITGLTTTILVTILYPKLAQAINRNDLEKYQELLRKSSSLLLILGIPFALGAAFFSHQVVQVVYERGAFGAVSTALTGEAFLFYGLGIAFIALNELLTKTFYSMRDTRTPVVCAGISVTVNIFLNLALINAMAHRGLALSTTIAAGTNTLLMTLALRKKMPELRVHPPLWKLLRILAASVLSVSAAGLLYRVLLRVWMPRIVYLGISVLSAVAAYLVLLIALKIEEVQLLKSFWRNK